MMDNGHGYLANVQRDTSSYEDNMRMHSVQDYPYTAYYGGSSIPQTSYVSKGSFYDENQQASYSPGSDDTTTYDEGPPLDMPSFKTFPGVIVLCIFVLITLSVFICLARPDFNLMFYLLAYYIWCIESDHKSFSGLRKLERSVQQLTLALSLVSLIDAAWLFMGFSSWMCEAGDYNTCFTNVQDSKLRWTYGLHNMALIFSLMNFLLKMVVIGLSFGWLQNQRQKLGHPA